MNDDDRYTRITLRIPKGLHHRLSDAADKTSKSLNAEIVARLDGSFDAPSEPYATESQLERVFKKIGKEHTEAMLAVSLVRDMLGTYVKTLFKRLPKADQQNDEYQLMHELARTAIEADAEGLRDAVARKMNGAPGFKEMPEAQAKEFFDYLSRANQQASKRRREVLDRKDPDKGKSEETPS